MSIEVSNRHVTPVCIRNVIERSASSNYPSSAAFAEGKAIGGNCVVSNIAKLPRVRQLFDCEPALQVLLGGRPLYHGGPQAGGAALYSESLWSPTTRRQPLACSGRCLR